MFVGSTPTAPTKGMLWQTDTEKLWTAEQDRVVFVTAVVAVVWIVAKTQVPVRSSSVIYRKKLTNIMDEEARAIIYHRNNEESQTLLEKIRNVSEKLSKIDQTKANWIVIHPSWYETPDSPLYDYLIKSGTTIQEESEKLGVDITKLIDENFWDLI
jgi:hypothetical protein